MNYPRPPQSPYPAPVDNGLAAWDWLTKEQGTKLEDIIISGDIAGGNLAISLVRKLKSRNTNEMPGGLILFSPWVQMIPFPSRSWASNKNIDYIGIKSVIHFVVDLYIDQTHPDDKDVSPVRADASEFEGFPPVWIGVGGAEEFHSKLQQANVKTEFFEGKGMPHVWQLFALSTPPPEAKFQVPAVLLPLLRLRFLLHNRRTKAPYLDIIGGREGFLLAGYTKPACNQP